ncbi:hypothetical protein PAMP_023644 [Pampus punctatissimus]
MREIYILLGHLFIAGVAGVGSECLPVQCLRCDTTGDFPYCPPCLNMTQNASYCINDISSKCKKDFPVSINATGSQLKDGDSITLTCNHDLPDMHLTFEWQKNGKVERGQNESKLYFKQVFSEHSGQYICIVNSTCGSYKSLPHSVSVSNDMVLLLIICGVSALVLVLIMGLVMKLKMKRDNIKHRGRMNRRLQVAGPPSITPRES